MERGAAHMSRRFHVVHDFAQFHRGQEVTASLYPDCFVVEGDGAELEIPYDEIEYVAHCDRPEGRMADYSSAVPFFFGGDSLMSFVTEAIASVGIFSVEHSGAFNNLFGMLFFVGYHDEGGAESWVMLQDERNYNTIPFVQELSQRTNKKVIHYFMGLERQTGIGGV